MRHFTAYRQLKARSGQAEPRVPFDSRSTLTLAQGKPNIKSRTPSPDKGHHDLMTASTSSRFCSIRSGVLASRFSRSSGSVFDARTLKCQSG